MKRSSKLLYKGRKYTRKDFGIKFNVPYGRVCYLSRQGLSPKDIIHRSRVLDSRKKGKTYKRRKRKEKRLKLILHRLWDLFGFV